MTSIMKVEVTNGDPFSVDVLESREDKGSISLLEEILGKKIKFKKESLFAFKNDGTTCHQSSNLYSFKKATTFGGVSIESKPTKQEKNPNTDHQDSFPSKKTDQQVQFQKSPDTLKNLDNIPKTPKGFKRSFSLESEKAFQSISAQGVETARRRISFTGDKLKGINQENYHQGEQLLNKLNEVEKVNSGNEDKKMTGSINSLRFAEVIMKPKTKEPLLEVQPQKSSLPAIQESLDQIPLSQGTVESENSLEVGSKLDHKLIVSQTIKNDGNESEFPLGGGNEDSGDMRKNQKNDYFSSLSGNLYNSYLPRKKGILINSKRRPSPPPGPITVYEGALRSQKSLKNNNNTTTQNMDQDSINRGRVSFNLTPEVRLVAPYIRGKKGADSSSNATCCYCTLI